MNCLFNFFFHHGISLLTDYIRPHKKLIIYNGRKIGNICFDNKEFDKGQIVVAGQLDRSISKKKILLWFAVVSTYQKLTGSWATKVY